jgi:hypothetical protein
MKYLFFFLLLLPLTLTGQKDFDYTFYTTQYGYIDEVNKDTMDKLTVYMKLHKEAGTITLSSLTNSGDASQYQVNYIGYDIPKQVFIYQTKDGMTTFHIRPGATVRIYSPSKMEGYY